VKRSYPPVVVIIALLVATLACSLTREEFEPTPEPTVDLPATIAAGGGTTTEQTGPAPVVNVTGIDPPSPVTLGDTVTISVEATHESAMTAIILEIARTDELLSGQQPQFERASRQDFEGEPTSVQEQLFWQPFDAGSYELMVLVTGQTNAGESIRVPIEIVAPVVEADPVGGAAADDPGPCIISPLEGSVVIRSASREDSSRVGTLGEGQQATAQALGRDASWQGWYRISTDGATGWVKGTLVSNEGGCTPGVHLQLQQ
jgi:hypothetical protein